MEQEVARRGGGVVHAIDFGKRVQVHRARRAEQAVPCLRSYTGDAAQPTIINTESDTAHKRGQVSHQVAHLGADLGVGAEGQDKENRSLGQLCVNGLGCGQCFRTPCRNARNAYGGLA